MKRLIRRYKYCSTTQSARHTIPPLQSIKTSFPLERVQIDVVDFEFDASQGYKLFLHLKDHFTKLSMLYPLVDKQPMAAFRRIYAILRNSEIIQCDNGKEFKGVGVERLLLSHGIQIINRRLRMPLVQGLFDKANGVLKSKMTTNRISVLIGRTLLNSSRDP